VGKRARSVIELMRQHDRFNLIDSGNSIDLVLNLECSQRASSASQPTPPSPELRGQDDDEACADHSTTDIHRSRWTRCDERFERCKRRADRVSDVGGADLTDRVCGTGDAKRCGTLAPIGVAVGPPPIGRPRMAKHPPAQAWRCSGFARDTGRRLGTVKSATGGMRAVGGAPRPSTAVRLGQRAQAELRHVPPAQTPSA